MSKAALQLYSSSTLILVLKHLFRVQAISEALRGHEHADGELDQKFFPVRAKASDLDGPLDDSPLARSLVAHQSVLMSLTKAGRHDHQEWLPQYFLFAVAEQAFRSLVPEQNASLPIRADNSLRCRLHDGTKPSLAFRQRGFGAFRLHRQRPNTHPERQNCLELIAIVG